MLAETKTNEMKHLHFVLYRYFAIDALVERNKGFGACNAVDTLNSVVKQLHKMLIIAGIHLDENVVWTCAIVAFHDFLNLL